MARFDEALRGYYDDYARVYDDMYLRTDPAWRRDLEALSDGMVEALSGRRVLELACGTGYWTKIVAKVAEHVVAIDASEKMLAVARNRTSSVNMEYRFGDAYKLGRVPGEFDGGLANFWFSHVPKARVNEFLRGFHKKLEKNAVVFMADNVYIPGIGGQLVSKARIEDTFKLRVGSDGKKYEVLKNYYNLYALRRLLSPWTLNLKIRETEHFWWVEYDVP